VRRVAAVLIHHPVLDRQGATVTTAITNLDLHDLARSAYCYGLSDLFVAHPIAAQRELASRVRSHWTEGSGARRIPERKPALGLLNVIESWQDALQAMGGSEGVELWVTSANAGTQPFVTHAQARQRIESDGAPVLIAFGTGWGLAPAVIRAAQVRLAPIESPRADGFNHLSVRAAAAILFDRLLAPGVKV
jgi:hypothetical protein